jgi:hypothetical protein
MAEQIRPYGSGDLLANPLACPEAERATAGAEQPSSTIVFK